MLFAIGTKVRLKHTGDEGLITKILGENMLAVFIADQNMEIPVFEEDLVTIETFIKPAKTGLAIPDVPPSTPTVKYEAPAVKKQELQLAFDPDYDQEGRVKKYQLFLINTTSYDYIFNFQLNFPNHVAQVIHGKLEATSTFYLQDLLFDQLNDTPVITIEYWKITTAGTDKKNQQIIKIKAQQFFKKVKIAPLLNRPSHLYSLAEPKNISRKKGDTLIDYTKKKVRPVKRQSSNYQLHNQHNVEEYANFVNEIDLHIENLTSKFQKMNNGEKLRLQLKHFEAFMLKAIRLGVPRVFIIHGLGKGKLRDAIASQLVQMPEVKTFKNEYHPRYGWGATEVIF